MSNIWDKKYIENHALKEGQEIRIPSYARMFYKDVMKQYEISPEKEETFNKVNLLGQKYGVYLWYSSKAKELLDCYEIIEAMEESLKYNQDKIKELDYKIDQATKNEEWTEKFNDLINGKVWVYSKEDYEKWNENYYKTVKIKNITKEQLELKRKEAISNAIKIDKLNYELTKTEDIGEKYQINTKIKALEEEINKIIDKLDDDIYHTYYIDRYKGLIELKDSIKEREKEMAELDYAYTKEIIYNITYNTIKNIMCIDKTM